MTALIDVHLPHMGVVEQAVLTSWLRSPGDRVNEDDPLCEVSTDKVDTEVPSPVSGVLVDYVAQVDDEVPVGAVIARFAPLDAAETEIAAAIREGNGTVRETAPPPDPVAAATPVLAPREPAALVERPQPVVPTGLPEKASLVLRAAWLPIPHGREQGRPATPLVRKLARERGLDLSTITGTGPGGRVTRKDVEGATAPPPRPAAPPRPARSSAATLAPGTLPQGYESVPHDTVPHTPGRRAIARNLVASITAPQVTAQVDVDMSQVTQVRAELNGRGGPKLSFLPFIARALCATAAEFPEINATFTDDHLIRWRPVHLGIAVDAPHGLLVPVVHDAERLTVTALAEAISGLATRVHERKSNAEDLASATITISNAGSVGGVTATPLLTPPQAVALGVPAIVRTPVAVTAPNGEEYVAIRPITRLGLTFDHRAFDGALALRALQSLQHKLETWSAAAYL